MNENKNSMPSIMIPKEHYSSILKIDGDVRIEDEGDSIIIRSDKRFTIYFPPSLSAAFNEAARYAEGRVSLRRGRITIKPSGTVMVTFRLTKEQYDRLLKELDEMRKINKDMNLSDLIRYKLFGEGH